jgi:hypothetical protein
MPMRENLIVSLPGGMPALCRAYVSAHTT